MSGRRDVLRRTGSPAGDINGMQFGEAIDLAGITGATLSGNTVSRRRVDHARGGAFRL